MKLLLDMNVSPAWVPVLVADGHQAVPWSSIGRADAPDQERLVSTYNGRFSQDWICSLSAILKSGISSLRCHSVVAGTTSHGLPY